MKVHYTVKTPWKVDTEFEVSKTWDPVDAKKRIKLLKSNPELLQAQVKAEYEQGERYMRPIIRKKQEQSKKIHPLYQSESVVRLISRAKKQVKSRLVWDRLQIEFKPKDLSRKSLRIAEQLTLAAELDIKEISNFDNTRDDLIGNVCDYGLGIFLLKNFDTDKILPTPLRINPLYTIPDNNFIDENTMRFWGYHSYVDYDTLMCKENYINLDEVSRGIKSDIVKELLDQKARNQKTESDISVWGNSLVDIYVHFTRYKGHLYYTVWANDRSVLLHIEEVEPSTNIEKKNLAYVDIPVAFYRMWRVEDHYFGESIPDIVEADQDTATILRRLQVISAQRLIMWPDTVYNSNLINSKQIAQKNLGWNLFSYSSDADSPILPSQVMAHIQENTPSAFVGNQEQEIVANAQANLGLGGSIQQGITAQGNQTKAEIQEQARSVDTSFEYINTLMIRGEKRFFSLWLRLYRLHLKAGTKPIRVPEYKKANLSEALSIKHFELDVREVNIVSKGELEMERKSRFAQKQITSAIVLAGLEPGSPRYLYMVRTMMKESGWYEDSQIYNVMPTSLEEELGDEIIDITEEGEDYPLESLEGANPTWVLEALGTHPINKKLKVVVDELKAMSAKQKQEQQALMQQQMEMEQNKVEGVDINAQNQLMNMAVSQDKSNI